MDLLDFEAEELYFDTPSPEGVEALLLEASALYGEDRAELCLLRAYLLAPENLSVLVALYRYYYYRHRLDDALLLAHRTLEVAGDVLGFPRDWRQLERYDLGRGIGKSFGLVRFYLLALKAAGYLNLRLRQVEPARAMLAKVRELDEADRLGAGALLAIIDLHEAEQAGAALAG